MHVPQSCRKECPCMRGVLTAAEGFVGLLFPWVSCFDPFSFLAPAKGLGGPRAVARHLCVLSLCTPCFSFAFPGWAHGVLGSWWSVWCVCALFGWVRGCMCAGFGTGGAPAWPLGRAARCRSRPCCAGVYGRVGFRGVLPPARRCLWGGGLLCLQRMGRMLHGSSPAEPAGEPGARGVRRRATCSSPHPVLVATCLSACRLR